MFSLCAQVFMMSVLWSDEAEVIVYRSFQEFKKFHVSNKHLPSLRALLKLWER